MNDPVTIQLVGLASGASTPLDGQWLVEYDPTRPGVAPDGQPMTAHVVCTPDPDRARTFPSATEAYAYWRRTSGLPYPADRPLTAYTIAVTGAQRG